MKLDSYESESINVGTPLISIISINYNNCNGLKKTILSIDALFDKMVNLEHLIIDGKSKMIPAILPIQKAILEMTLRHFCVKLLSKVIIICGKLC